MPWKKYSDDYYERRAVIHEVKVKSFDPATGVAVVEWRFDLKMGGEVRPWKLTDPEVRHQLGLNPPPGFENAVEGYRYELPAIVTWYGVPQKAPNMSVELDPGCPREPVKVASAGPRAGFALLAQGEKYVAEVGKPYTATARFKLAGPVPGQTVVPPFDVAVAGLHQVGDAWYPARLEYAGGDGEVRRQAGLEPWVPIIPADVEVHVVHFNRENNEVLAKFNWTANAKTRTLAAVINYTYPEENPVPCLEILYPEGESGEEYGDNVAVVPIEVKAPPDFSVALDKDQYEADPGDKVTIRATFKMATRSLRPRSWPPSTSWATMSTRWSSSPLTRRTPSPPTAP
jgi:hypothetical protein